MASKPATSSSVALLNGLFAVRKPIGITSAKLVDRLKFALQQDLCEEDGAAKKDVLQDDTNNLIYHHRKKKKRYKLPKMGHGGTLDMNASGVLVIGCGNGTKKLSSYLQGGKIYLAEGRLGKGTNTMDSSGEVVETAEYGDVTETDFRHILKTFTGEILQVPPIYSALKVGGKRMSDLAAAGVEVQPKNARPVQVFSLKCVQFSPPDFTIDVHCGGGFYVRKLIHDIGKSLGTCAHMTSLVRTQQGCFSLEEHALPQERWTLNDIIKAIEESREWSERTFPNR